MREVILAMNATVEGQTTAHYITDRLAGTALQVTRLAHGVPVGGELDYLDEGTLTAALSARTRDEDAMSRHPTSAPALRAAGSFAWRMILRRPRPRVQHASDRPLSPS